MPIAFYAHRESLELTPVGDVALEPEDTGLRLLTGARYALDLRRESGDAFPKLLPLVVLRDSTGALSVRFPTRVAIFEQLPIHRPLHLNAAGEASRTLRWSEGSTQREECLALAAWVGHGRLTVTAQLGSSSLTPARKRSQPSTFVGGLFQTKALYVGELTLM